MLVFKYFDLPLGLAGRGGVQRFFMLTQNIPFKEEVLTMDNVWAEHKEKVMLGEGHNPCGGLPVTYGLKNDKGEDLHMSQHIATCRYLARLNKKVNADTVYAEYVADLVADEYQGWRDAWANVAFTGTDAEKDTYRKETVPAQLKKFEALYGKFAMSAPYLCRGPDGPLWADAALFGLMRDHMLTGLLDAKALASSSPRLNAMFEAYAAQAPVAAWLKTKEPAGDKSVEL